jgi:hypothetical protein
MVEGVIILAVDERPSISRAGKPQNEVIITIETDFGATGSVAIPQAVYNQLAQDDEQLSGILTRKRDELNKPFLLTL